MSVLKNVHQRKTFSRAPLFDTYGSHDPDFWAACHLGGGLGRNRFCYLLRMCLLYNKRYALDIDVIVWETSLFYLANDQW